MKQERDLNGTGCESPKFGDPWENEGLLENVCACCEESECEICVELDLNQEDENENVALMVQLACL
jgi:hypothetical protein